MCVCVGERERERERERDSLAHTLAHAPKSDGWVWGEREEGREAGRKGRGKKIPAQKRVSALRKTMRFSRSG